MSEKKIEYLLFLLTIGFLTISLAGIMRNRKKTSLIGGFKTSVKGLDNIKASIQSVKNRYGIETARWVERIYRLETRNFKSGQFIQTGSAGMEKHSNSYPYGWTTPAILWDERPDFRPVGFIKMNENGTGIGKEFLIFPSVEAAMLSLGEYVKKYGPGRWYSINELDQIAYVEKLLKFDTSLV